MKERNPEDHLTPDAILHYLDGGRMPIHTEDCTTCKQELEEFDATIKELKAAWMPPQLRLPETRQIMAMVPALKPAQASSRRELVWITGKWLLLLSLACLITGLAHHVYPHAARGITVAYDGWGVPGLTILATVLLSIISSPVLVLLKNVQPVRRSIYT